METPQIVQQQKQESINLKRLKYYISLSSQPIPDIINQKIDIYSEFKFFFNDEELSIYIQNCENQRIYALHDPEFEEWIRHQYQRWYQNENQQKNELYRNFIAFTQNWVQKYEKQKLLTIEYLPFDEAQQIEKQQEHKQLDIQLFKDKLKNHIQYNMSNVSKVRKIFKIALNKKQKMISQYFNHFATKRQNVAKISTFDQLQNAYSTIQLSQWVRFAASFFITNNTQQYSMKPKKKKISVKQLKKIFDSISTHKSVLEQSEFKQAIVKLYSQLFGSFKPDSVADQQNYDKWLRINTEEQFRKKMNELGVYIPKNPTKIYKCKNSLKSIQPRYLISLENISTKKSQKGIKKHNIDDLSLRNKLKINKDPLNPIITNQPKVQEKTDSRSYYKKNIIKKQINIQQALGIDNQIQNIDPDEYLSSYYNKASMGVVRRIDERIQKYISSKQQTSYYNLNKINYDL